MISTIVLVTTSQPSANPRMLKEAVALQQAGYRVTVIYSPVSPWAETFDREIFLQYPMIQWVKAGYHPIENRLNYQFARIRRRLYHYLFKLFGNVFDASIRSFALFSEELCGEAMSVKADLYIGHNIGAMPAVVKAAKKFAAKAVFDFEDFHRGEDLEGSGHWKKIQMTEDKYVAQLSWATTASPFITEAYQRLYPSVVFSTINNCFPLRYGAGSLTDIPLMPLKLFWFSQFVGPKRGLETVLEAIGKTGMDTIELSLLGNCNAERKKHFVDLARTYGLSANQLHFLPPVEEAEIVRIASQHHIGLATEVPHILNRELCLTNKLFMYLHAGNAIVFSHTKAQAAFLATYPTVGCLYEQGNAEQLAGLLLSYIRQPDLLAQQRRASLELGKTTLNWEKEQQLLLKLIRTVA